MAWLIASGAAIYSDSAGYLLRSILASVAAEARGMGQALPSRYPALVPEFGPDSNRVGRHLFCAHVRMLERHSIGQTLHLPRCVPRTRNCATSDDSEIEQTHRQHILLRSTHFAPPAQAGSRLRAQAASAASNPVVLDGSMQQCGCI